MAIYILLIGVGVGVVASRGSRRSAGLYVPVALLGALVGAFAAFGDAPLLMRYPFLNPFTLAFLGSAGLVTLVWAWRRR